MQRLEDDLRIMRKESKAMMDKMTEIMATMLRVKAKERRRSPVEPRRAPPSRTAPKGLRLHRE